MQYKQLIWASVALFLLVSGVGVAQDQDQRAQPLAAETLEIAGVSAGICCVLGADDIDVALALAQSSRLVVHVLDPRADKVDQTRRAADAAGLHGKQVLAEQWEGKTLPYADKLVDIVVCTSNTLRALPYRDIMRVLRPGGKAILSGDKGPDFSGGAMTAFILACKEVPSKAGQPGFDKWTVYTQPAPQGMDDWSHWEHGPDNNPVSTDQVIKAPYMTQYFAKPYYIAMPAITTAAGGRTFLAMGHIAHHEREEEWLNTLVAYNGYNGAELWRRKLPDGYMVHRSAFVATDDAFYMIQLDGTGCDVLDPETGEDVGRS